MVYFKVLTRHLTKGTEEKLKIPQAGCPEFWPRFEPKPPEYEAKVLNTTRRSAKRGNGRQEWIELKREWKQEKKGNI